MFLPEHPRVLAVAEAAAAAAVVVVAARLQFPPGVASTSHTKTLMEKANSAPSPPLPPLTGLRRPVSCIPPPCSTSRLAPISHPRCRSFSLTIFDRENLDVPSDPQTSLRRLYLAGLQTVPRDSHEPDAVALTEALSLCPSHCYVTAESLRCEPSGRVTRRHCVHCCHQIVLYVLESFVQCSNA